MKYSEFLNVMIIPHIETLFIPQDSKQVNTLKSTFKSYKKVKPEEIKKKYPYTPYSTSYTGYRISEDEFEKFIQTKSKVKRIILDIKDDFFELEQVPIYRIRDKNLSMYMLYNAVQSMFLRHGNMGKEVDYKEEDNGETLILFLSVGVNSYLKEMNKTLSKGKRKSKSKREVSSSSSSSSSSCSSSSY